jgi:hypothetical protein
VVVAVEQEQQRVAAELEEVAAAERRGVEHAAEHAAQRVDELLGADATPVREPLGERREPGDVGEQQRAGQPARPFPGRLGAPRDGDVRDVSPHPDHARARPRIPPPSGVVTLPEPPSPPGERVDARGGLGLRSPGQGRGGDMSRRDVLIRQLEPLLEPGEVVSHAFVANAGDHKPAQLYIPVLALTDRNVVEATATHAVRWKVHGPVGRRPRAPFPDLPRSWWPGPVRWTFGDRRLWLDGPSRREARRANATFAGPVA